MKCRECVLRNDVICLVSQRPVDLSKPVCQWGRRADTIQTCEICGNQFESLIIDMTYNKPHFICEGCLSKYYTCYTCKQQIFCGFTADQNSPDYVMRRFQQGNQIIQTQVRNPDKIDIYCKKCKCWDNGCMKEWGTCRNYEEKVKWF